MEFKYTDNYTSKYRYGRLYSKGIPHGKNIYDKLKSDEWELKTRDNHIKEMNDNRMDRNYGFTDIYTHKTTNKIISVHCDRSATGKTLNWTFSSNEIDNLEEFKQLLNIKT
ncbi:MAG: hypothetical protein AB7U44_07455 [Sulfuricurvum sp.]